MWDMGIVFILFLSMMQMQESLFLSQCLEILLSKHVQQQLMEETCVESDSPGFNSPHKAHRSCRIFVQLEGKCKIAKFNYKHQNLILIFLHFL